VSLPEGQRSQPDNLKSTDQSILHREGPLRIKRTTGLDKVSFDDLVTLVGNA
jgi:hypothetical protein